MQIQNGGQTLYLHISSVNYPISIKFGMQIRIFIDKKKSKFCKFKMADGRHIENCFWLYIGAILADQREIWNRDEGSHADIGHVNKTATVYGVLQVCD